MRPNFKTIFLIDYLTQILLLLPIVFTIITIIRFTIDTNALGYILLAISFVLICLFFYRLNYLINYIEKIYSNQAEAKIVKKSRTSKMYFFTLEYEVNGEVFQGKCQLPRGNFARILSQQNDARIIYDPEKHRKVYILDFIDN